MKESIGGVMVINIIVVFMIIVFGLLAATFSYAKAYKVNTRIMNGIEIFEGYNKGALNYINSALNTLGYNRGARNCPKKVISGVDVYPEELGNEQFSYCIYKIDPDGPCYYSYVVETYIRFDLPLVPKFEFPVKSQTNRIFDFTHEANASCYE